MVEYNSVDELIIPFKGRSSLKQYVRNKPHKWGIKVFARAGSSGIVYDFEEYVGKGTVKNVSPLGISGDIVLRLVDGLPKGQNYSVYGQLVLIFQPRVCPQRITNFGIGNC